MIFAEKFPVLRTARICGEAGSFPYRCQMRWARGGRRFFWGNRANGLAFAAARRTVFAGPVEATALGNVLLQAVTLGHLASLAALRETVRASFAIERYEPQDRAEWEHAAARFAELP